MKNVLKLEEAALFALSLYLFNQLHFVWWWFPALLLVPDISMLGYLVNSKVGGICYNIFHHRLSAVGLALYGWTTGEQLWQLAAIMLFAHISFDRIMGYGLKYLDSFNNTHLGRIGKG